MTPPTHQLGPQPGESRLMKLGFGTDDITKLTINGGRNSRVIRRNADEPMTSYSSAGRPDVPPRWRICQAR
ncbi:hypothetical protein HAV15_007677 [Penicillium sp. str. |nr:hypothetical protein HAV15_007677 [Penicillium sp. str. \